MDVFFYNYQVNKNKFYKTDERYNIIKPNGGHPIFPPYFLILINFLKKTKINEIRRKYRN